jgi:O-antigen/teichoic acid export membrane protein
METAQIVQESLQKVTKGTAVVLAGTAIGMALGLGASVLLVRNITPSEYGVYSLASVLVGVVAAIATLGLPDGATRYIAFLRARNDSARIRGVIFASLWLSVIASLVLFLAIFFTSGVISTRVFHNPELAMPLRILSATIPISVLTGALLAIYRGYDRVDVKVYFQDILRGVTFLVLLGMVVLFGWAFLGLIYAVLASAAIALMALAAYAVKRFPLPSAQQGAAPSPMGKELLRFSVPLLVLTIGTLVVQNAGTLLLGYLKDPGAVALYNASMPLAQSITVPLIAMTFIYVPVVSQLYSKGLTDEMKRSYQVLTKWIFFLSFPVGLVLILFPITSLNLLFGSQYAEAAWALRLLSLGLLSQALLGANGMTLLIIGRPGLYMRAGLIMVPLNIGLSVVLIPRLGATGAAIAFMVTYFAANGFCAIKLYQLTGIHPFTRNYVKPIIASGAIIAVIYIIFTSLFTIQFWMLPLFFVLFLAAYGLAWILTRSFDSEDIMLLLAIEQRTGIDATLVKNILRRFV